MPCNEKTAYYIIYNSPEWIVLYLIKRMEVKITKASNSDAMF